MIKEFRNLFDDLRKRISLLPDQNNKRHYEKIILSLAESIGPLFRDKNLPQAIEKFKRDYESLNLGDNKELQACLNIASLSDFTTLSEEAESMAIELLDRVVTESSTVDVRDRQITQLVFETTGAAKAIGTASAAPILRQVARASHIMALEAIIARQADEGTNELTQPMRRVLDAYFDERMRTPSGKDNNNLVNAVRLPDDNQRINQTAPPLHRDVNLRFTDTTFINEVRKHPVLESIFELGDGRLNGGWICPAVYYNPLRALPGDEITIERTTPGDELASVVDGWPPFSGAIVAFPTAYGATVSSPVTRTDDRLLVNVPEAAVSGEARVLFEREGYQVERLGGRFGLPEGIIPYQSPYTGKRYCFGFLGGLSGFRDLVISDPPGDQRCYAPGDRIWISWVSSNLDDEVVVTIDGVRESVAKAGDSFLLIAPDVDDFRTLTISVISTGPGPAAPAPYVLTQDITIEMMPSDRVDPTPASELVTRTKDRVDNFYLNNSQTLHVFRPNTLSEIRQMIRSAEADNIVLGIKSTGGSYEEITFPQSSGVYARLDRKPSALLDLSGMVFDVHGHPSILEHDITSTPNFTENYDIFISSLSEQVQASKEVLRTQLRGSPSATEPDDSEVQSVLGDTLLATYNSATGITPQHVRDRLVYLDAGTKVWDANKALSELNLVLPTLGASGFQSLAGAISTGTHGSTFRIPPISDFVRAIHLMGPGGTEWWIEPDGVDRITTKYHLSGQIVPLEELIRHVEHTSTNRRIIDDRRCCNFIAESDLFDDTLVSFGQAGAVVGYVMETIDAHSMRSFRVNHPWADCRAEINEFVASDGMSSTSGSRSIGSFFPSDRFWYFSQTVSSYGEAWTDYRFLTSGLGDRGPVSPALSHIQEVERDAYYAAILIGAGMNITDVINREFYDDLIPHINSQFNSNHLNSVDEIHRLLILQALGGDLRSDAIESDIALSGSSATYEDWTELIRSFKEGSTELKTEIFKRQASSHELALDATNCVPFVTDLLDFASERREIASRPTPRVGHKAILFNVNIRFTQKSRATMAIQKSDLTAHLEIFSSPQLSGHSLLYAELERLAELYSARPHWGQKHENHDYEALYDLDRWRESMQRLSRAQGGQKDTFGSAFARTRLDV